MIDFRKATNKTVALMTAMALTSGGVLCATPHLAIGEEEQQEQQATAQDTMITAEDGMEATVPETGTYKIESDDNVAELEVIVNGGTNISYTADGRNVPLSSGTTVIAHGGTITMTLIENNEPAPAGNGNSDLLPSEAPVVKTFKNDSFKYNNEKAQITITQKGPSRRTDGNNDGTPDSLKNMSISFTDPSEYLTVDKDSIKVYVSTAENSDISGAIVLLSSDQYTVKEDNGTYTVEFAKTYLDGTGNDMATHMSYANEIYTITADANFADISKIRELESDKSGNITINTDIRATMKADANYGDNADSNYMIERSAETKQTVQLNMPQLHVIMTKPTEGEKTDAYETVTYHAVISNSNTDTVAHNVVLTDAPGDDLYKIGGEPTNVTVTKNRSTFPLNENNYSMKDGTIRIVIGDVAASDNIEIDYTVKVGNGKSDLSTLSSLDSDDIVGNRTITVSADNAMKSDSASKAFDLLRPAASVTASSDKTKITTGEKATVTVKYNVTGVDDTENGATLINPKINIAKDNDSIFVSNVKITTSSGKTATYSTLSDLVVPQTVKTGDIITVTYDVTAPDEYTDGSNSGINTSCSLSADNIIDDVTANTKIDSGIPKLSSAIEVSDTTPSSEDIADGDHPVQIKATVTQEAENATAKKTVVTITDSSNDNDPVDKRFQNLKVNGNALSSEDYSVDDGILKITGGYDINEGEKIEITYDDILKTGYETNGETNAIAIRAYGGTGSNIPSNGDVTATTSFTMQTPRLHSDEKITSPIDDEGKVEIVNVGDTVAFKATFNEDNDEQPDAIGRDFRFTASINDIELSDGKHAASDLGVSFVTKNGEKPTEAVEIPEQAVNEDNISGEQPDPGSSKAGEDQETGEQNGDTQSGDEQSNDDDSNGTETDPQSSDTRAVSLYADGEDVTGDYNIAFLNKSGEDIASASTDKVPVTISITGNKTSDATKTPTSVAFKVYAGDDTASNFDQLSGKTVSVSTDVSVSNLKEHSTNSSSFDISDAALSISKSATSDSISHGDRNTYTIVAENDADDKFSASSVARDVTISDDLDEVASKFGYKIDPSSVRIQLDGKDITSTSEAVVLFDDANTGFDVKISDDLAKKKKLVITYDTTTDSIDANAYSQSLGNVVIARADNSKPSVATSIITYNGVDLPSDASSSDSDGAALGQTGDNRPYIIAGIIAIAVVAGAVVIIVRRRNR